MTDKEIKDFALKMKKDLLSHYNSSLNEGFSNIWGTTWLMYNNNNTGEGQLGKEPVMSLFFNPETQKVLIIIFQISHITVYDCVFGKTDYSMFLSAEGAKMTFPLRMISPSTMRSTDGSMIFHRVS